MVIRAVQENDLPQLVLLYNSLYDILNGEYGYPFFLNAEQNEKALKTRIKSKLFHILAAEEDGVLLGFVLGSVIRLDAKLDYEGQKTMGRIDDIYVRPEKRGGGIASKLMDAIEDLFREEEVTFVEGFIVEGNTPSWEFHEKRGWKSVNRRIMKKL